MKKMVSFYFTGFSIWIIFLSCSGPKVSDNYHFIYLSHTRGNTEDSLYRPVYDIDFSNFDMTLLGGDLVLNTFSNDSITAHLDQVFNFKSPAVLWSIGNHDKTTSLKWRKITHKKKYHKTVFKDVTFITLNSQDSLSSIVGNQREFLENSLDSIETRSLIIMSHKLIFMNNHPKMDTMIFSTCNAGKGDHFYSHNNNNFYEVVYPKLLEVKNRGVQIIWVGGDLGYKTSQFELVDKEGITFLGNGLYYPRNWNKVLIFTKEDRLPVNYEFVSLDSISKINEFSGK